MVGRLTGTGIKQHSARCTLHQHGCASSRRTHVRGDVVLPAEVQHLLRLLDAADQAAGDALAAENQRIGRQLQRVRRHTDCDQLAVKLQQVLQGGSDNTLSSCQGLSRLGSSCSGRSHHAISLRHMHCSKHEASRQAGKPTVESATALGSGGPPGSRAAGGPRTRCR